MICAFFLLAYSLDLVPATPPPSALAEAEVWEEDSALADSEPALSQPSLPAAEAPASSRSSPPPVGAAGAAGAPSSSRPDSRPPHTERKTPPASSAPQASSSESVSSKEASSRPKPTKPKPESPKPPKPSSPGVSEEPPAPSIVNLNTATEAELCTLRGIGPVLAGRIIEFREACGGFSSVEELLGVSGIGEKKLAAIRDYVTVE